MSTPHRCPVCQGVGQLPNGFYNTCSMGSTTDASSENCRTCGGQGFIWNMSSSPINMYNSDIEPKQPPVPKKKK